MTDAILAEGLVKRFGATTALAGVDLAVRTGTVFGLLGPNGAGKTTAVRILATLLPPDGGRATVGGHDVLGQPHRVRQLIGLTGQYASVDETLTGAENLVLIGRLLGLPRAQAKRRAGELLAAFRLDVAASLVGRPRVLFLDEPTTGLDPRARTEMWEVIRTLVADGVTVLLTTQYLEEADQLADEISVVDHGRVIATGTPEELKAQTGGQFLAVRPAHRVDLQTVISTVAQLAGGVPEVRDTLVTAPVADPVVLPAVVRRLDDAGVLVAELELRGSSLDEVFLSLTGHRAEQPADPDSFDT